MQETQDRWIWSLGWRRKWQPTPVFLRGKSHGQRSLEGCSLWGWKELDMTEHAHVYAPAFNKHYMNGDKESACQCRRWEFDSLVRKIPWRRQWLPIPVFLPGKSHGQRSLVGYSPWGRKSQTRLSGWACTHARTHSLSPLWLITLQPASSTESMSFSLSGYLLLQFVPKIPYGILHLSISCRDLN